MPNQKPTPEQIKEFDLALENFHNSHDGGVLDLGYKTLLEKENSLRRHFELSVFKDFFNSKYDRINRLFESDETLFKIKDNDDYNILQIAIICCHEDGISFIKRYIDKFIMEDELKNKLISDCLFYESDSQDSRIENCIEIIEILVNRGVKITNEDLKKCWQKKVFEKLVKHAEPSTLKSGLFLIFENDITDEDEIQKIKYLLEEKGVGINDFLERNPKTSEAKNNFVDFVLNHGDETTKTSFLAQLSSSSSEQRDKFFEGLSEENLNKLNIVKFIYEKNLCELKKIINSRIDILLEPVILTQIIKKYPEFLEEKDEDDQTLIDRAIDGKLDTLKTIIEAKPEFLEKQNRYNETPLLNLLSKYVLEPSPQKKEKIKYIFKKQFKRDLEDEKIPDFVEFTRTYNFFNLFYDKYGQYMYDRSFRSTLLSFLPEEDLQDDLSNQLLEIYQQIAEKKVPEITYKDDTGKQTHLYSYHAELNGHASHFIFHVNDEKKLTKISYCDGHQIFLERKADKTGYINGTTTFLLKNPQDFNDKFAKEFIKNNSGGQKVLDFKEKFCEKLKEGKIFDFEFSTMTHSIPTKIQSRSNCTLKSANTQARFFLEQLNQHHKPHESSLFILDPAQGKVIGEGNKAYKDLKESMSQEVAKKLIEDLKKVPDDFVKHIELFSRTNNKFQQARAKEQKIKEFCEALQSFAKDPNNLRYRDLLEKDHSLFYHLKKVVYEYIEDYKFQKINLLLENSKISDPIFKFEFKKMDVDDESFHGTILTHSVIACSSESLDLIKKHISKFKLGKDSEGNNLLSLLMRGVSNQEGPFAVKFCIEISKILFENGVCVDDKNNDEKTPLDFCYDPELFKILANNANQETLEKNLRSSIENEDWIEQMFEKDGCVFINIKFLLTEKNVKIDGFLDWNFSCPALKNNFTELVCQDDKIKESFLAQLSSSSSEQRDKFFEDLNKENLSLILDEFKKQKSKQGGQDQISLKKAIEEFETKKNTDPHGVEGCMKSDSGFYVNRTEKNRFAKEIEEKYSEQGKDAYINEYLNANPQERKAHLTGLETERLSFMLSHSQKMLKKLENFDEITEKLESYIKKIDGTQSGAGQKRSLASDEENSGENPSSTVCNVKRPSLAKNMRE
jgi:hypothetical protein